MKRMFSRVSISIVFILVSFTLGHVAAEEAKWERLRETDDGISVKAKEMPGSNVRAVTASLKIPAPPDVVIAAAADPDTFEESGKYVEKYRVYRTKNPKVWHVYYLVNFPIISRRDYTLRYEQSYIPPKQMHQLAWHASTTVGPPPSENVVRVTLADGWFQVTPLKDGGSLLRYYVLADPGGSLPSFLINLANRSAVPDILRQVRDASLRQMKK